MTGGLLQIASYGSQDIYLTGNPEITFFKVVYRRHTNFSVESIEVPFENSVEFDDTATSFIPIAGDLISKIYLKIKLPELDFKRVHTSDNKYLVDYNNALKDYHTVQEYTEIMMNAHRLALETNDADNVKYSDIIAETIIQYFNGEIGQDQIIDEYTGLYHIYSENSTNYKTIANLYVETEEVPKSVIMKKFEDAVFFLKKESQSYFNIVKDKKNIYEDDINTRIKIAWVDKIGHNIIDHISISIGGNRVDKHYGEWFTIWNELTESPYKEKEYAKMIGDIDILTTFDRSKKPSYTLIVPLQFWFCRYYGLSLPLIALQYTDVSIDVKFRPFRQVTYIEENGVISINGDKYSLDELTEDDGIILDAHLLIDYIYLDQPERRRFAQSAHEYLIDQVQMLEFNDIDQDRFNALLDFYHPSKEIIWTAQKMSYRDNINGFNKTNFDKFTRTDIDTIKKHKYTNEKTLSINYKDSPIDYSYIDFNGYTVSPMLDSIYYGKVVPYSTHSRTPADGIHVFSMAIKPEEQQPTGHGNLSRISKGVLGIEFNKDAFYNKDGSTTTLSVRIYVRNMNILRFIGGWAGLAYIS